jgi:ketosteroid isomerase-like protein
VNEATDAAAIRMTTAALLSAVNRSDLDGVLAVWSDDGVMMPPHHPSVTGRRELERYFTGLFAEIRFSFRFTHPAFTCDTARAGRVRRNSIVW